MIDYPAHDEDGPERIDKLFEGWLEELEEEKKEKEKLSKLLPLDENKKNE